MTGCQVLQYVMLCSKPYFNIFILLQDKIGSQYNSLPQSNQWFPQYRGVKSFFSFIYKKYFIFSKKTSRPKNPKNIIYFPLKNIVFRVSTKMNDVHK